MKYILSLLVCIVAHVQALTYHAEHSIPEANYQAHFNEWSGKGYILKYVSGFEDREKKVMYNTIWHKNTSGKAWKSFHGLTEPQYQDNFNTQTADGYWPVFVDGFSRGGAAGGKATVPRICVIYEKPNANTGAKAARHGQSSIQYQASFDAFNEKGLGLQTVSQYETNGVERFASLFAVPSDPQPYIARHNMEAGSYQTAFNENKAKGFTLAHVSASSMESGTKGAKFAAIWKKDSPAIRAFHGIQDIQAKIDEVVPLGYIPTVIDGYLEIKGDTRFALLFVKTGENLETPKANGPTFRATQCFDQLITNFMIDNDIPGANTAVLKDGKLVYSQGYGTRDVPGIGSGEVEVRKAMPYTPFRLASVSKPITSLAILRLVQNGSLKVTDKVFGTGGILENMSDNPKPCCAIADARIEQITIEHLLRHQGGWNRDIAFDPMFRSGTVSTTLGIAGPASCEDVIYYMFGQVLQHDPGTTYSYSNFGCCILGQVIKEVTGKGYQTAVRELVLNPSGVSQAEMYQGRTQLKDIPSHESEYYCPGCALRDSVFPSETEKIPNPYGAWHLEAMDAHGAWVASAQELMKVIQFTAAPHCNGNNAGVNDRECLFTDESWDALTSKSSIYDAADTSWYGYGFSTRASAGDFNIWHGGSLPGTSTLIVRTNEAYGYAWALNFNVRGFDGNMDSLMWSAVKCVDEDSGWPTDFAITQLPKDEKDPDAETGAGASAFQLSYNVAAGAVLLVIGQLVHE